MRPGAGGTPPRAGVGGGHGRNPTSKWGVDWYMVPVTPETHPWVYTKNNDPKRFVVAIEMLGDVYYTAYIAEHYPGAAGTHYATADSDN